MECKNCVYFQATEDKEWNGKEHCCFREWGHEDWETAPCDEPEWDNITYDEYDYPDDYYEGWD